MATTPQARKIKGGKPIGRQKEARKRKMTGNPYWSSLRRKKLARVKKSNGAAFAAVWAKEHMHA